MISAGFDPTKNEMAGKEYPSNWPSYQADLYSRKYTYKDVKGQTMLIQHLIHQETKTDAEL